MEPHNLNKLLPEHAFNWPKWIIGSQLINGEKKCRIIEVEIYRGKDDPGSHAYRGKTKRNSNMFGPPGYSYIYLNYGIHWLLNIVVEPESSPAAILIRGAIPISGFDKEVNLIGPGRLTKGMGIERMHHNLYLFSDSSNIYINLPDQPTENIIKTERIGLSEKKGKSFLWRFVDSSYKDMVVSTYKTQKTPEMR